MASEIIQYTPEGAVKISYTDLVSSPLSLHLSIEKAFGSDPSSLGIIVVTDLPKEYHGYRERLLKLANVFANLPETTREKYADPSSNYSFGWSHGKEIMNGRPDLLKGSFYANPVVDDVTVNDDERAAFPQYYGKNIWPSSNEDGVETFQSAFKDLGRFIFKVGCELAAACQPFVSQHLSDSSLSVPKLISESQTTKARLLNYFPPTPTDQPLDQDEPVDSWCGFHLDHSLLTGLCSAMYLQHTKDSSTPAVIPSPSTISGLYIRDRGGKLTKVAIPTDCLAFQTGEVLELITEGRLRATPHCVRVGPTSGDPVSRTTFALFMQPNTDRKISKTDTFGSFSKKVFSEHYAEEEK